MRETIIRTLCLLLVLVNQILCAKGVIEFQAEEDQLYEIVSGMATIIVSAWCWWKNNSFTKEARKADEYMKKLKAKRQK